ncbi:MAG: hypothetical protein ACREOW_07130 [Thermodesulfobacteriota bacterium]
MRGARRRSNPTLSVVLSVSEGSNDKSLDPSVALLLQDDAIRQIATTDFVSLAMTDVALDRFTEFNKGVNVFVTAARNVIEMTVYERVSLRGIKNPEAIP